MPTVKVKLPRGRKLAGYDTGYVDREWLNMNANQVITVHTSPWLNDRTEASGPYRAGDLTPA